MFEDITRELILEWAYNNDIVIDMYESGDDGDAAILQSAVMDIFGAKGLLDLAADPACPSRLYLAGLLSECFLSKKGTDLILLNTTCSVSF